jgi:hypothetical protein
LIPYIGNGPLIFWLYPVFGIHGASWFLAVAEWLFCALLFAGFWNKGLGILGALGSVASFVSTVICWKPAGRRSPAIGHEWNDGAISNRSDRERQGSSLHSFSLNSDDK